VTDRETGVARIRQRLTRMAAQRRALQLAVARYADDEGQFDLTRWTEAFESANPATINQVVEVTGGYQMLVNHLIEALRTGATLAGMAGRQSGRELIAAIRDDGGFSPGQAEVLVALYRTRNRLQHASPDIQADEIHDQVTALLRAFPRLVRSFVDWMARHDVGLD
jgi:uncharacterized protein YutE (UPF0331/DUF86 family)